MARMNWSFDAHGPYDAWIAKQQKGVDKFLESSGLTKADVSEKVLGEISQISNPNRIPNLSYLPKSEIVSILDRAAGAVDTSYDTLTSFDDALKQSQFTPSVKAHDESAGQALAKLDPTQKWFLADSPVGEHHTKDGKIEFYNPSSGKMETRDASDFDLSDPEKFRQSKLDDASYLEEYRAYAAHPDAPYVPLKLGSSRPSGEIGLELAGGGRYDTHHWSTAFRSLDTARQGRKAEAERDAERAAYEKEQAEEKARRERQVKIDALNKRITFEKTNPLTENRRAASGRVFEAISPGREWIVPEGADILSGSWKQLPFMSREKYNIQAGETEERILGRGQVKKTGILGEEEEETLGTKTLLGA